MSPTTTTNNINELYQQIVIDHNRSPKNFKRLPRPTHSGEGYNPLCGDHFTVDMVIDNHGIIKEIGFSGTGCAISKSSISLMTAAIKDKTIEDAQKLFEVFHQLLLGNKDRTHSEAALGKLAVFSGIWQYPSRVKCAILGWYTMKGALENVKQVSTENSAD